MSVPNRVCVTCFMLFLVMAGCSGPPSPDRIESSVEPPLGPPLPFEECTRLAIGQHTRSQREFQRDLQELVVASDPDDEALATIAMQLQLAKLEWNEAQLNHLLEHDPSRIGVDGGLGGRWQFEWDDADSKALLASAPDQARIQDKIESLGQQYEAQPGRREFAEQFRNDLALTREYEQIMDKLEAGSTEVDRTLKRCEPLDVGAP